MKYEAKASSRKADVRDSCRKLTLTASTEAEASVLAALMRTVTGLDRSMSSRLLRQLKQRVGVWERQRARNEKKGRQPVVRIASVGGGS